MTSRKTFVLVHGAWLGGWAWQRIVNPLRSLGHQVYTPTLTGLGERCHLVRKDLDLNIFVEDVVNVLKWEDLKDVVLVGHSFSGVPITGAADRVPERIRHLVYLDALILQANQSPLDVNPPEVAAARRKLSVETSGGLTIPVPDHTLWGINKPEDIAWIKARCVPHPISTWESKLQLKNQIGNNIPTTYIASVPYYYPTSASRLYAQSRKDWKYQEISAGHCSMITEPNLLIGLLSNI